MWYVHELWIFVNFKNYLNQKVIIKELLLRLSIKTIIKIIIKSYYQWSLLKYY